MWADRVLSSDFEKNALSTGLTSEAELIQISTAFRDFAKNQDGWYTVLNGELVGRK